MAPVSDGLIAFKLQGFVNDEELLDEILAGTV